MCLNPMGMGRGATDNSGSARDGLRARRSIAPRGSADAMAPRLTSDQGAALQPAGPSRSAFAPSPPGGFRGEGRPGRGVTKGASTPATPALCGAARLIARIAAIAGRGRAGRRAFRGSTRRLRFIGRAASRVGSCVSHVERGRAPAHSEREKEVGFRRTVELGRLPSVGKGRIGAGALAAAARGLGRGRGATARGPFACLLAFERRIGERALVPAARL